MIREPESSMVSPPIDGHYQPPKRCNSGQISIPQAASTVCKIFIAKRKAMPELIKEKKNVYCNASTPSINTLPSVGPRRPLVQGQVRPGYLPPATAGVCNRTRLSSSRLFLLLHSWKRVVWTHCLRHPLLRTFRFIDGAEQLKWFLHDQYDLIVSVSQKLVELINIASNLSISLQNCCLCTQNLVISASLQYLQTPQLCSACMFITVQLTILRSSYRHFHRICKEHPTCQTVTLWLGRLQVSSLRIHLPYSTWQGTTTLQTCSAAKDVNHPSL